MLHLKQSTTEVVETWWQFLVHQNLTFAVHSNDMNNILENKWNVDLYQSLFEYVNLVHFVCTCRKNTKNRQTSTSGHLALKKQNYLKYHSRFVYVHIQFLCKVYLSSKHCCSVRSDSVTPSNTAAVISVCKYIIKCHNYYCLYFSN